MTNVEQIYRRFVEKDRRKFIRLVDDDMKWPRLDNGPFECYATTNGLILVNFLVYPNAC